MTPAEEKLKKLRAIFTLPHDQQAITDLEKHLRQELYDADLLNIDSFVHNIEDIKERIGAINLLLVEDSEYNKPNIESVAKRQEIIGEKRAYEFVLSRFGVVIDKGKVLEKYEQIADGYLSTENKK